MAKRLRRKQRRMLTIVAIVGVIAVVGLVLAVRMRRTPSSTGAGAGAPTVTQAPPVHGTSPPGGVTAEEILAAVTAAGLPVPNVRDSSNACRIGTSMACTRQVTNAIFTVREWATPEEANQFAKDFTSNVNVVIGNATVSFHRGSSTPPYDLAAYQAALPDR